MENPTSDLLLLDDLLGEEEGAVRDRVRRFCDERVRPVINEHWEKATFPFELLPPLAGLGACGGSFTGHGLPALSPLAAGLAVVAEARDLMGGDGILLENDVARHLGDMEVGSTVEGTDVVHALIVGREITGTSAFT